MESNAVSLTRDIFLPAGGLGVGAPSDRYGDCQQHPPQHGDSRTLSFRGQSPGLRAALLQDRR